MPSTRAGQYAESLEPALTKPKHKKGRVLQDNPDFEERRRRLHQLLKDFEQYGRPSSPVSIFNRQPEYYGKPNSSKRNFFSNLYWNKIHISPKTPERNNIQKYYKLLIEFNVTPSTETTTLLNSCPAQPPTAEKSKRLRKVP